MTLEEAKRAAEQKSGILLTLPFMRGEEMRYTADKAGSFRRRGKTYEYIRLIDRSGCVVIADPQNCRLEEKTNE